MGWVTQARGVGAFLSAVEQTECGAVFFRATFFFVSLQSVNAHFMRAAQDFVPLFQQGAPGALLT